MGYKKVVFFLCFVVLGFHNGNSQETILKGQIIDQKTRLPISNVHLISNYADYCVSDSNGFFELVIDKFPVVIQTRHLSYESTTTSLSVLPENEFIIFLITNINTVKEIQIFASKIQNLSKTLNISLKSFEFDNNNLWMIGYHNNRNSNCRLILANEIGDTIMTKDIDSPSSLYKDVYDNVHLIEGDSSFQLHYSKKYEKILLLYATEKDYFLNIMDPILAGFRDKLVYKEELPTQEKVIIYCIDQNSRQAQILTTIFDSVELQRKNYEKKYKIGSMWLDLKRSRYWMKGTKIAQIYEGAPIAPIFSIGDSLIIVDIFKDSLLIFNKNGSLIRKIKITFHKKMRLGNPDYMEWSFIIDPITKKTFVLERKNSSHLLYPFNLSSGTIGNPVSLPKYGGITNIRLFNDNVFFLYNEKTFPHYVRLFRLQM